MSLVEAAACGRPLIATNVMGCREIAREGVNALLVPLDDAPALAAAIKRLADDSELRRRFGAASRQIVENEYAKEHVAKKVVAIYAELTRISARPVDGPAS